WLGRPERLVDNAGEEGIHLRRAPAPILLRGEVGELDRRVLGEQPQQLHARVARGAEHRNGRARRWPDRLHAPSLCTACGARNAAAAISASSTADACAPWGGHTSCARPRPSPGGG